MRCPFCGHDDTQVKDSRPTEDNSAIRRRRFCPACGSRKNEIMPDGECVYFYNCTGCGRVLKPIYGDCCVFCSYATVICPNEQRRALQDAGESMRRYVGDLRQKVGPKG